MITALTMKKEIRGERENNFIGRYEERAVEEQRLNLLCKSNHSVDSPFLVAHNHFHRLAG